MRACPARSLSFTTADAAFQHPCGCPLPPPPPVQAIMLMLVKRTREGMTKRLIHELYSEETFGTVLAEEEEVDTKHSFPHT